MTNPVGEPNAENRTAFAFAAALDRGDYREAVRILTAATNAGDVELAATLLEGSLAAGMDAIRMLTTTAGPVSVTQTIGTVEAGATHIGVKIDRIG